MLLGKAAESVIDSLFGEKPMAGHFFGGPHELLHRLVDGLANDNVDAIAWLQSGRSAHI
jgi:hypothetical protein